MCIDYTSLNKACPIDPFPLPRIDQIVNSISGCDLLCFLDAYSSFHQIPMSRDCEEYTVFIIVDDLFCYVFMPYGLKNALPIFVRAMHKIFGDLIRDLIEVYVDDIVVKIKSRASLLDNLAQVFDRLRSTRTKLNPDKCVFGLTVGKLLGFLVSYWGIEANPEKIKTFCHTQFLCQNRVLIVCMTQDQMFHTYGQKGSQKTKCHNIKYNYYRNIVFID
jgi:hypothetical protein